MSLLKKYRVWAEIKGVKDVYPMYAESGKMARIRFQQIMPGAKVTMVWLENK